MARLHLIIALAVLVAVCDAAFRVERSPQFAGASARAGAGGFGRPGFGGPGGFGRPGGFGGPGFQQPRGFGHQGGFGRQGGFGQQGGFGGGFPRQGALSTLRRVLVLVQGVAAGAVEELVPILVRLVGSSEQKVCRLKDVFVNC
ncbi:34 kDa spicule matrix protein-like [Maniola hyperantus]|uniref:34 kDa spicule matrix protein-like n=1 Tax=Aphantopus hyperantus TaxID=2795564 RepID=UPI001569E6C7|nr:T-cell leukemia homeobox protein 1-like [Maniola hyperantus]